MVGADDYMVKPVKPMTLDIRIRSMMRIAALQRASTAVIDNVIEGIVQIDRAGRIGRFNKAAETIFGYADLTKRHTTNISLILWERAMPR